MAVLEPWFGNGPIWSDSTLSFLALNAAGKDRRYDEKHSGPQVQFTTGNTREIATGLQNPFPPRAAQVGTRKAPVAVVPVWYGSIECH